jgi:hypothetical protein
MRGNILPSAPNTALDLVAPGLERKVFSSQHLEVLLYIPSEMSPVIWKMFFLL